MDPISQGALGAIAAGAASRNGESRRALSAGWIAGMLADLDVLIRDPSDPLLNIEYHRHFTHSLIFIPVGALIASLALSLVFRGSSRLPYPRLYLYCFLGYSTSGLLDAFTSYGTQLLWPFSSARIAWNSISIIDPLFTGPILILIALHFWKRRHLWSRIAVGFAVAYLSLGILQRERALAAQEDLIAQRGHSEGASMQTVKPSFANLLVWRSLYAFEDKFYVDAIRVTPLTSRASVYVGQAVPVVKVATLLPQVPQGSALAHDLARFDHFSASYLAWHPRAPSVLGDLRYATIPNSILPIWGIRIDFEDPRHHAPMLYYRDISSADRQQLLAMLAGRALD